MASVYQQPWHDPCPNHLNLAEYVLRKADAQPEKVALRQVGVSGTTTTTYGELSFLVRALADGILKSGINPGDTVLMRLDNTVDFPVFFLAAIWAGVVPVPSSTQLTSTELDPLIAALKPKAIVYDPAISLSSGYRGVVKTIDELRSETREPLAMACPTFKDQLAYIVFTSGMSGTPKGVRHAHRAIWARRSMYEDWYGLSENDFLMHAGAFNWTYTLGTGLMDPWSVGATAVIAEPGTKTSDLPALVAQHGVSILAGSPGVFRQFLKAADIPSLPNLRHALSAGEHLPESLAARWSEVTGTRLHEALGMSECSTFISGCPERNAEKGTIGYPQRGRRVAVLNIDGDPAPFETEGSLAVSGDDLGLMLGYLGEDDLKDEWFVTSDKVSMTQTGAVTYFGRGDDIITAGGFKISPIEIENAFREVDGLEEVAAIECAVGCETQLVGLCYVVRNGMGLDEHALRAHGEQKLAKYKQPRVYIALQSLTKGGNGKINRRALRQRYGVLNDKA